VLTRNVWPDVRIELSCSSHNGDGGREGDALPAGRAFREGGTARAGEFLQADVDEAFWRDVARTEAIDGDIVAGVGIGHGIERGVKVFAVGREREAGVEVPLAIDVRA